MNFTPQNEKCPQLRSAGIQLDYQTLSELMLFQNSFKLGARLMIEVVDE